MKQLKSFRLSRGWRIARNLAAAFLLAALALLLWGWPAWMGRWAFRHLETQYLLAPSQVVLANRDAESGCTAYLCEGEGWITVGRTTPVQHGGLPFPKATPCINHLLPKEGIVVAALPACGEGGTLTAAVWGAPAEAVSGTLELELIGVDGGLWPTPEKETFTAQGSREENGWFFFQFAPHDSHPGREICAISALWAWDARIVYGYVGQHPYRLTLTDAQGAEVASQSGTLPPNQCLTAPR